MEVRNSIPPIDPEESSAREPFRARVRGPANRLRSDRSTSAGIRDHLFGRRGWSRSNHSDSGLHPPRRKSRSAGAWHHHWSRHLDAFPIAHGKRGTIEFGRHVIAHAQRNNFSGFGQRKSHGNFRVFPLHIFAGFAIESCGSAQAQTVDLACGAAILICVVGSFWCRGISSASGSADAVNSTTSSDVAGRGKCWIDCLFMVVISPQMIFGMHGVYGNIQPRAVSRSALRIGVNVLLIELTSDSCN